MPPPLPLIPSSSSISSAAAIGTANIRVLVRVRPHNHAELTERGTIGRSNVLTLDSNSKSNQGIDFNNESNRDPSSSSSSTASSATITVKGVDDNDVNGGCANSSVTASASVANSRRRLTGNNIGYSSDNDNTAASTLSSSYSKQFTFDAVHGPRSTQSEVYESVKGIVDAVVQGYNGTIVCYGQTGSGKTFTMCGGNGR